MSAGNAMINLKRGLLRAWVVIAVAWIGLTGWRENTQKHWDWDWTSGIYTKGECWDRIAKWPDGQPFNKWDVFNPHPINPPPEDAEINRKRRDWVEATLQKLRECEAAAPVSVKLTRIWPSVRDSLPIILLPPFALLIAGYIIGWVVRGFRAQA
jgi:hypothetical protein